MISSRNDLVYGMMFYIEESFWCLIDSVEKMYGKIQLTFKSFLKCWLDLVGFPIPMTYADLDDVLKDFENYKRKMPISCAFITCIDPTTGDQEVLLVKSATSKKKRWMLPGGKKKVYENEGCHAAMVREVLEETGLDLALIYFKPCTFMNFDRRITVFFLEDIAKIEIVPPNQKEIKEAKWFRVEDLISNKIPRMSDILIHLIPRIKTNYSLFRDEVVTRNSMLSNGSPAHSSGLPLTDISCIGKTTTPPPPVITIPVHN